VLIESRALLFQDGGSILFNIGTIWKGTPWWPKVEHEGIWAISGGKPEVKLAYQSAENATVSPDGNTLVKINPNSEGTAPIITLYSMASGESVEVALPPPIVGKVVEGRYPSWLPDGRLRFALRLERLIGQGEIWEIFTVDPKTEFVERSTLELNLPEYFFFEHDVERGIPSGFVAVDPTYQRVLYTSGSGLNYEVRLLNLESGEILWRGHSSSLVNTAPEWSADGESVLFKLAEPISGTTLAWSRIVKLTRDGLEEVLPPQPFPRAESYIANVSRSPDGRFIFYSLHSYETGRLHGYVIDTQSKTAGDVCDPDDPLLGGLPYDSVEVSWLPEGQLVYRVLKETDGQLHHSLRVLDIPSWTAYVVLESPPGYGVNYFGWTPIDLP
jgi:hypothetical protein